MGKNNEAIIEKLENEIKRLKNVIVATNMGIWQWDILEDTFYSNDRLTEMLGYTLDEFPTTKEERAKLIDPASRKLVDKQLSLVLEGKIKQFSIEYRMKHKNGSWIWIHDLGRVIDWSDLGSPLLMAGSHQDITDRKAIENALKESVTNSRQLVDVMPLGLVTHEIILDKNNEPIDYSFVSANKLYEKQTGLSIDKIRGKTVLEVFPKTEAYWIKEYGKVAITGKPISFENYSKELNKHFKVQAYSPKKGTFAVLVEDITVEKERQLEIEYLSNHDFLSGLYNRRYFVNAFESLDKSEFYPITIMMMDVNGLKIINDAFGHEAGDEVIKINADIISKSFSKNDVVCRIGGDEFAVIMPNSSNERAIRIKEEIFSNLQEIKIKSITLSLAIGFETKENGSNDTLDYLLKQAENYMYRHKITEGVSGRNNAIKAIFKTLTEKYKEERNHSTKVSTICKNIGKALGIQGDSLKELEMAGLFHDIGKIALPDAILYKPGKLTEEEYEIVKTHPEIGYQILRAADEYSDLAVHALYHHERWDGFGYPSGKKGEDIPFFSRIICVADAFEAMTAVRPYKDKMSIDSAADEIIRCAGSQFDYDIAKVFVTKVLKKPWNKKNINTSIVKAV